MTGQRPTVCYREAALQAQRGGRRETPRLCHVPGGVVTSRGPLNDLPMSLKMPTTSFAGLIVDVQPALALTMSGKNIDEVEAMVCIVVQAEIGWTHRWCNSPHSLHSTTQRSP